MHRKRCPAISPPFPSFHLLYIPPLYISLFLSVLHLLPRSGAIFSSVTLLSTVYSSFQRSLPKSAPMGYINICHDTAIARTVYCTYFDGIRNVNINTVTDYRHSLIHTSFVRANRELSIFLQVFFHGSQHCLPGRSLSLNGVIRGS